MEISTLLSPLFLSFLLFPSPFLSFEATEKYYSPLMANDNVAFVILRLALYFFLFLLYYLSFFFREGFYFFFPSDVTKPLYLSREKPVAGLYWTDYHAPSVGAIRDARARIQGPVTCPAGERGGCKGEMGGCRARG